MPTATDLRVVQTRTDLARAAAGLLAGWCEDAIAARGRCHLALAGGSTPRATHARLTRPALRGRVDWSRVDFYFGDERRVPRDHPESNFRMACDSLLDPLGIPAVRVHPMPVEHEDGALRYQAALPARLDVLMLGIGPDGHTASLFPGHPAVLEPDRAVLRVHGPKPPPERLTITPAVIRLARRVLVLASGAAKAAAVGRALTPGTAPLHTPASLAASGVWVVTAEAAP